MGHMNHESLAEFQGVVGTTKPEGFIRRELLGKRYNESAITRVKITAADYSDGINTSYNHDYLRCVLYFVRKDKYAELRDTVAGLFPHCAVYSTLSPFPKMQPEVAAKLQILFAENYLIIPLQQRRKAGGSIISPVGVKPMNNSDVQRNNAASSMNTVDIFTGGVPVADKEFPFNKTYMWKSASVFVSFNDPKQQEELIERMDAYEDSVNDSILEAGYANY